VLLLQTRFLVKKCKKRKNVKTIANTSKNDDFIKIFMYFNAKTAQKHIEFYMNNNYTIFRTFKED